MSGTFTFTSGYFTAAYQDGQVTVSDDLGDSKTVDVVESGPTFETFGWAGVSTITITPINGEHLVVFDNLSVSTVPEASTWAMMILGFAGLGFACYRSSRKSVAAAA